MNKCLIQFVLCNDQDLIMVVSERPGFAGFEECIGVTRSALIISGLWPMDEHKNVIKKYRFLLPAVLIILFIIIPQTRKVIQSTDDLNVMIEVLSIADMSEIIAIVKLFGLWYYKQDLRKVIVQMSKDWYSSNVEEQNVMWPNAKSSRFIATCSIAAAVGAVMFHTLTYIVAIAFDKNTENITIEKPLYLKSIFPFDTQHTPVYEIICVCQCVGAFWSAIVYSSFDCFFACTILHFSSQCRRLKLRLPQLKCHVTFTILLKSIVREHQTLVRYTSILENNFNKIMLVQIVCYSLTLCLQGYQLVMIISDSGLKLVSNLVFIIVFLTSTIISVFICCYIAQAVRTESEELFNAVYEIDWYELYPNDLRMLFILRSRFLIPIELTVGKFGVLSLQYFASIVKTSVGYLSMLLAVKNKH